jgi:hypothetical protein
MRAWRVFRQLLAATLCAVLVAPAYPSESTLPRTSSTPSHTYDAETLPETRVWGSSEKILLHFRATLLLSEKQRKSCAKCSWKNVVGSVVTYDYDAFGNLLHQTGTTPNNYLFAGEQFDPTLESHSMAHKCYPFHGLENFIWPEKIPAGETIYPPEYV